MLNTLIVLPLPLQTFWEDVRVEMVDEKGLSPECAHKIGQFVQLHGMSIFGLKTVNFLFRLWSKCWVWLSTALLLPRWSRFSRLLKRR